MNDSVFGDREIICHCTAFAGRLLDRSTRRLSLHSWRVRGAWGPVPPGIRPPPSQALPGKVA